MNNEPTVAQEKALVGQLADASRKVKKVGKDYFVPQKFDEDGEVLSEKTFDVRKHLKRLRLSDFAFLKVYRESNWNEAEALKKSGLTHLQAKKLIRKLNAFKREAKWEEAMANIPTTSWITAKHVENILGGGKLEESERDSLKELAKMNGAYKTQATVNIQTNVFNMPTLTFEQEEQMRKLADSIAVETEIVKDDAA